MCKTLLVSVLTFVLVGCATSHSMRIPQADLSMVGLMEREQAEQLKRAITDDEIAALLNMDVQPRLPAAVAMVKLHGNRPQTIDAEELNGWQTAFANSPQIVGVQPLSPMYLPDDAPSLRTLRSAAAMQRCELLLVYLVDQERVNNLNDAAVLYWTLVGLFVVPGNVYEHRTAMQAALIDCRTGLILGTATGDCHRKRIAPTAFEQVQWDRLSSETPKGALADLQSGCGTLMARLCAAAETATVAE
jgi:hypothetical protein